MEENKTLTVVETDEKEGGFHPIKWLKGIILDVKENPVKHLKRLCKIVIIGGVVYLVYYIIDESCSDAEEIVDEVVELGNVEDVDLTDVVTEQ